MRLAIAFDILKLWLMYEKRCRMCRPAFCACCTGRYSETSDLDLFVLMRNEDGYKACVTFILGGCGAV